MQGLAGFQHPAPARPHRRGERARVGDRRVSTLQATTKPAASAPTTPGAGPHTLRINGRCRSPPPHPRTRELASSATSRGGLGFGGSCGCVASGWSGARLIPHSSCGKRLGSRFSRGKGKQSCLADFGIKDRRKERERRDLFGRFCLSFQGLYRSLGQLRADGFLQD